MANVLKSLDASRAAGHSLEPRISQFFLLFLIFLEYSPSPFPSFEQVEQHK